LKKKFVIKNKNKNKTKKLKKQKQNKKAHIRPHLRTSKAGNAGFKRINLGMFGILETAKLYNHDTF